MTLSRGKPFAFGRQTMIWSIPALVCAALAAAIVATYPIFPGLFGAALAGYAIALWRWPRLWLLVVPTVLPAIDFTFWTGLLMVSEADAVILVTLAVLYCREPPRIEDFRLPRWGSIALACVLASYALSILFGLLPIEGVPSRSANPYLDSLNALRLAKGFILPLLLLPYLARAMRSRDFELFAFGMLGGLALVTAAGMLERKLFVGNLDFTSGYRIVATFSSMHIGGGHVGTYLAMTLPFLAVAFLRKHSLPVWGGILLLAPLSALIFIATFARAGYLAGIAGLVILILLWLTGARLGGRMGRHAAFGVAAFGLAGLIAIAAISRHGFMAERFGQAMNEYVTRGNNWRDGLAARTGAARDVVFGMGLGTYPRVFAARNSGDEKGTDLELGEENGRHFVAIADRSRFYFAQRVPVLPNQTYRVSAKIRTPAKGTSVGVGLCENILLFSRNCSAPTRFTPPVADQWISFDATLSTKTFDERRILGILRRPIELSFDVPEGSTAEIADVKLTGPDGENLAANGDFSLGLRRWLFHDDSHQGWRIQNQYLDMLFEQGWFGLASFVMLLATAFAYCVRAVGAGNPAGAIVAASLVAFSIAGMADYLTEAPRLAILFYLVCFTALLLPASSRTSGQAPEQ